MKYLLSEGTLIQIINLLKQHPFNEVEGLIIELNSLQAIQFNQNPIGFNSPIYNEEETEEEYDNDN